MLKKNCNSVLELRSVKGKGRSRGGRRLINDYKSKPRDTILSALLFGAHITKVKLINSQYIQAIVNCI